MTYELWDNSTGNLIDWFSSEDEAMELVRAYLAEDGPDYVADLGMGAIDEQGKSLWVIQGAALVDAAQRGRHARQSVS